MKRSQSHRRDGSQGEASTCSMTAKMLPVFFIVGAVPIMARVLAAVSCPQTMKFHRPELYSIRMQHLSSTSLNALWEQRPLETHGICSAE